MQEREGNALWARTPPDQAPATTVSETRELRPLSAVLRRGALFRDLGDEDLERLADLALVRDYPRGAFILRQGDPGRSLLVVLQGVVEVLIEREQGEAFVLSQLGVGDFFGEMSLFDGGPRSASARAVIDVRVAELDRDIVMERLTPRGASRLLAEIAMRVRKTDGTLAILAERLARSANSHANTAVAVELDAIKTFYQRSEHLAADTLERAERRAGEALQRAEGLLAEVEAKIDHVWTVLKHRAAPIGAVLVLIFGGSLAAVAEKLSEFDHWYTEMKSKSAEVNTIHQHMLAADRSVRIVTETMTALRGARDAAGLGSDIDSAEKLKRINNNYEPAKRAILNHYLAFDTNSPEYAKFEPEVVFEAVDSYVTLVMGGRRDGRLVIETPVRRELLAGLGYVLENLSDAPTDKIPDALDGSFDRKLRDMVVFVAQDATSPTRAQLLSDLRENLTEPRSQRARQNTAVVLATLGVKDDSVLQTLTLMLHDRRAQWSIASALALAKLGDARGRDYLVEQLDPGRELAFATACLLAEQGRHGIDSLAAAFHNSAQRTALLERVRHVLSSHEPANCFEERYAHYLLGCVTTSCEAQPAPGTELSPLCSSPDL